MDSGTTQCKYVNTHHVTRSAPRMMFTTNRNTIQELYSAHEHT